MFAACTEVDSCCGLVQQPYVDLTPANEQVGSVFGRGNDVTINDIRSVHPTQPLCQASVLISRTIRY